MNGPLTAWPLGAAASLVAAVRWPRPMRSLTFRRRRDLPVGRAARLASFLVVVALLALALPPAAARAATFTPASTAELIAAITTANANGTDDIIDLGGGAFTLTAADNAGAFGGSNGLPIIQPDAGHRLVIRNGTVRRDGAAPGFRIFQVATGATLELETVTLTGGNLAFSPGGGIVSFGSVTLTNSTLSGNTAFSGGGIYNADGTLTLTNSTLSGNSGPQGGGGIFTQGGTVIVAASTLSGNTAEFGAGGGIFNSAGTLTLTNSTLSGNSAGAQGGGIMTLSSSSRTTLVNSTLSGNTAFEGGGIDALSGTVTFRATILDTGSLGPNCDRDERFGTFVSLGSNLADDATCFPNAGTDKVVANNALLLGALADNGGPTLTHALLAGSPAIDAVVTGCPPPVADQRGVTRPQDGDGSGVAACDSGAFEAAAMAAATLSIDDVVVTEGNAGTTNAVFTVTLTNPSALTITVNFATADDTATSPSDYQAQAGTLTFTPGGPTTQTITVPINGDTTIEPDETFFVNLSGATNAAIADTQGQGTIVNDDALAPTARADLRITKAGPASVTDGTTAVYTITITNAGPNQAEDVVVRDPTPTGLTFVSTAGACTTAWPCNLGAIPSGQSRTITTTFGLPDGYSGPNPIANTTTVTSATADPDTANNAATARTVVGVAAVNDPNNDDDEDEEPKETEEQRQQRERTNTGHRGDVTIEGNVFAVMPAPEINSLLVTIALTRNETQVVQVPCSGSGRETQCPDIRVGDYLQADGYQNGVGDPNTYFVASDGMEVTRNGRRVK